MAYVDVDLSANEFDITPIIEQLKAHDIVPCGYEPKVFCKYDTPKDRAIFDIYYAKQKRIQIELNYVSCQSNEQILKTLSKGIYGYIIAQKINEKENKTMPIINKSEQELEFDRFEDEARTNLERWYAEEKADVEKEIEKKRLELREEQNKAEQEVIAKRYWYFFSGLKSAGFTEDQAMQIMLKQVEHPFYPCK